MLLLYAMLPVLVFFGMIFLLKQEAHKSLLASALTALIIALAVWHFDEFSYHGGLDLQFNLLQHGPLSSNIGRAGFLAIMDSLQIWLILLSSLVIFRTLESSGAVHHFKSAVLRFTHDPVHLAVLFAFCIGSFFEAVAGFGTVQAVIAPLLYSVGFPAFASMLIALLGNGVAALFGSFGTPFGVGMQMLRYTYAGGKNTAELLSHSAFLSSAYSVLPTLILLVSIAGITLYLLKRDLKNLWGYSWFLVYTWLSFSIPFVLTAKLSGILMPSFTASAVSFLAVYSAIRSGLFKPMLKLQEREHEPSPEQPKQVFGKHIDIAIPFVLYALIALLLLFSTSRTVREALTDISISVDFKVPRNFLGQTMIMNYTERHSPLIYPGPVIALVALGTVAIYRKALDVKHVTAEVASKTLEICSVLFFAHFTGYIMLLSAHNSIGLTGMIQTIGNELSTLLYSGYEYAVPFIGLIGSMISGSAALSNMMMVAVHAEVSAMSGTPAHALIALQALGASAGIMACMLHIVIAMHSLHHGNHHSSSARETMVEARLLKYALVVSFAFLLAVLLSHFIARSIGF